MIALYSHKEDYLKYKEEYDKNIQDTIEDGIFALKVNNTLDMINSKIKLD